MVTQTLERPKCDGCGEEFHDGQDVYQIRAGEAQIDEEPSEDWYIPDQDIGYYCGPCLPTLPHATRPIEGAV